MWGGVKFLMARELHEGIIKERAATGVRRESDGKIWGARGKVFPRARPPVSWRARGAVPFDWGQHLTDT